MLMNAFTKCARSVFAPKRHNRRPPINRFHRQTPVKLAQTYQAGSIVLPKLGDKPELIQSEIQARAEQKIPGYIEAQGKYAKRYRVNVH